MNVNTFLEKTRVMGSCGLLQIRPRIICRDGVSLSVQASASHYSTPRDNRCDYEEVEVGYPSEMPPKSWGYYFGDDFTPETATHSIYAYIPIDMVQDWIDSHGGISYRKTILVARYLKVKSALRNLYYKLTKKENGNEHQSSNN